MAAELPCGLCTLRSRTARPAGRPHAHSRQLDLHLAAAEEALGLVGVQPGVSALAPLWGQRAASVASAAAVRVGGGRAGGRGRAHCICSCAGGSSLRCRCGARSGARAGRRRRCSRVSRSACRTWSMGQSCRASRAASALRDGRGPICTPPPSSRAEIQLLCAERAQADVRRTIPQIAGSPRAPDTPSPAARRLCAAQKWRVTRTRPASRDGLARVVAARFWRSGSTRAAKHSGTPPPSPALARARIRTHPVHAATAPYEFAHGPEALPHALALHSNA